MRLHRPALLAVGVLTYLSPLVAAMQAGATDIVDGLVLVISGPVFATVGIVILLNRPGHRLGRLLLIVGVGLTITTIGPAALDALAPLRWTIRPFRGLIESVVAWSGSIAILCGTVFVLVWFPDGRATSRLGRVIEIASLVFLISAVLSSARGDEESAWVMVFLIALYGLSIVELGARTVRAGPRDRAAMRWVLGSAVVLTLLMFGVVVFGSVLPGLWNLWIAATVLPAVAVAIAISRHHLYDIDRLVSRTIAYTLVTVILVTLFGGLVIGLQWVLAPMTNGETIVVAASTLIVATLFAPLRARVQTAVDRRFDRSAYDASRTVEAYAGRLRDELDLVTLTADLRRVTSSAVHPTATGVWLRSKGRA